MIYETVYIYIYMYFVYMNIYGIYGWVCCVKGKFVCFVRENSLWFYIILYIRLMVKIYIIYITYLHWYSLL